ncbi:enhancer of filamentation 1-like isoform X1 [Myxocyprinus asiaticus]|uniref:enhancer of filamentation 1-like isoform X1 n=2 Tax=Myxocyprinus asiaticus TaxID=70543 RepID=UPI002223DEAE|nr:enhancer of filamentation 1-like isoform X1 [Myxocyprinus asiaticus]
MKYKNLMAKALYDNVPESPEELAFRKGDILTVIEQNTGGLEGWWLCSLHGRQGIAPGNRLKLLIGPMFDGQTSASSSPPQGHGLQQRPLTPQGVYQVPPSHQSPQGQGIYQIPPSNNVYQVPQRSALAVDGTPCKVVTPIRVGQTYAYSPASDSSHDLYDVPPVRPQGVYDIPPSKETGQHCTPRSQGLYDTPPSQDLRSKGLYDIPLLAQGVYSTPPRSNIAQDEGNYDFPQPSKHKQEGIYDVPPTSLSKASPCSNYNFPHNSEPVSRMGMINNSNGIYDVPASQLATGGSRDLYDIPRGMPQSHSRLTSAERDRNKCVYDVPPTDDRLLGDVTEGVKHLSFSSTESTRSSMSTSSSLASSPAEGRLALDLDSAVQRLGHLQQSLESSVCALQTLVASPHWRTYSFMKRNANEVRVSLDRVKGTLAEFLIFGRGAAANATALSDPGLHSKLRRQLQRLEDSQQILQQTHQTLENNSWALNILETGAKHQSKSDELERFVMVSRTVPDDAKQLASTIGGSAELLFRRAPIEGIVHPFTCTPTEEDSYGGQTKPFPVPRDKANMNSEKCVKSWMEDYDYVHLQGKDEFERQQKELLEKENIIKQNKVQLGQEQLNQFKQLEQEVIKPVENDITKWITHQHSTGSSSSSDSSSNFSTGGGAPLCLRDRQLLGFYADQCEQNFVTLLNAVDAFFGCVKAGQPPRIFVAHGKFVILSAHKLVFIGDTLSRQALTPEVANRIMNLSNVLCEMLKTVVGSTKMAALHYPNTAAVQEMVDRVTDLSHLAQQFKVQLSQMAGL